MSFDLKANLKALGITDDLIAACPMVPCEDCTELTEAGLDLFNRPQRMTPGAFDAWQTMKSAARADGLELKLVSAYRSTEYQCELIRRKLDEGRTIEDILKVNAIPGYSEHHSGRALDLHAGEGNPLELEFENHPAFTWLCERASEYNFYLSYPKGNPAGIDYEPWHWCFSPTKKA